MAHRDVVLDALAFRRPAYVPWAIGLNVDCAERLRRHLGSDDLSEFLDDHFLTVGAEVGLFEPAGPGRVRDGYGVTWDRTVDPDIGTPCDWPIKRPADLDAYEWPEVPEAVFADAAKALAAHPGRFRRYAIGFSLYERAWTMRGMAEFMMDMVERSGFVDALLDAIVEHNLAQITRALDLDIDCVHFGDDYGMQTGLQMGAPLWRRFILPRLERMFAPVRAVGKAVSMHSCGRVQEVFDDLVAIGLNLFNPFQPEVMDVFDLLPAYRGRLAFHGGMSIQKTLPFGSADDVREMAGRLIDAGRDGGYVFSPSHSVPRDVPPANLVAMMEVLKAQPGRAEA